METVSVRNLHLNTSALLKQVASGQTFAIQNHGVPIAELRPVTERRSRKMPDREVDPQASLSKTDSGRVLEEDRS